jgi:gliding motility-associated-like protein
MENNNNNDSFFREAFRDFERKPSEKVWSNIEKGIKPSFIQKTSIFKSAKFIVSSSIIITLSVILFYFFQQKNNQIIKDENVGTINKNQITDNKTIIKANNNNKDFENKNISQERNENPIKNTNSETYSINSKEKPIEVNAVPITQTNIAEKKQNEQDDKNNLNNANSNTTKSSAIVNNKTNYIQSVSYTSTNTKVSEITFSTDQNICKGEKAKLFVNGGKTFLWSTGERAQEIYVSPDISTDYSVAVIDENGNRKTGLITVTVSNCQAIYVPNAFTPNGDGQHDVFKAIGNGISKFEIIIVSRSGQVVYTSKNIDDGWDGNIKGNPAPMGTYVYSIKYIDELNKPQTINGHVNIIR